MRTTIGRGAIYTVPNAHATQASLHVTYGNETVSVAGYRYVIELGPEDDAEEDEGVFLVSEKRYSGYTLSECLCASLIDMQIAEDWPEAIAIVEEMGVPYVTDEDVCAQCGEDAAEYYTRDDDESTRICGKCYGN